MLQKVMHNNAGVYRNEDLLAEGCVKMTELSKNINDNIRVCNPPRHLEQLKCLWYDLGVVTITVIPNMYLVYQADV